MSAHRVTIFGAAAIKPLSIQARKKTTSRIIVPVNVTSDTISVRFTNRCGEHIGSLDHAVIARCDENGTLTGECTDLSVNGNRIINIPAGEEVETDPIPLSVIPGDFLAVSVYCSDKPMTTASVGYLIKEAKKRGEDQCTENFEAQEPSSLREKMFNQPQLFSIPYFKSVIAETTDEPKGLCVFGDSITAQGRWWYPTLKSLYAAYPGKIVMSNYGICGNQLTMDAPAKMPMFGLRGLKRIDWDGYSDEGVTDLLFALGINDIGFGGGSAETFIEGCRAFVDEAHRHGLKVYALCIYPATPDKKRLQEVEDNRLKCIAAEKEIFDDCLDLDPILKNPDGSGYIDGISYGDGTHLLEAGGQKLAEALVPFLEDKLKLK